MIKSNRELRIAEAQRSTDVHQSVDHDDIGVKLNIPIPDFIKLDIRVETHVSPKHSQRHQIIGKLWCKNDELEGHGRFLAGAGMVRVKFAAPTRPCMPACTSKEPLKRASQGRTRNDTSSAVQTAVIKSLINPVKIQPATRVLPQVQQCTSHR